MNQLEIFKKFLLVIVVTYLIWTIPTFCCRGEFRSRFLRTFLKYMPYSILAAMTFPAVFYSTGNIVAASLGTLTAILLSWKGKNMTVIMVTTVMVTFLGNAFLGG